MTAAAKPPRVHASQTFMAVVTVLAILFVLGACVWTLVEQL